MIVCCDKKNTIILAGEINPQVADVVKTYAYAGSKKVVQTPSKSGLIDTDALLKAIDDDTACVLAANPNYFGLIEDMEKVSAICAERGVKFIYQFNPISAALLKSPGEVGADIAIGEGQPLGMPVNFGGPYLGIMTCANSPALLRRMPGRIVGQTEEHVVGDRTGQRGFVLTLQAREQHIRREKAFSSICSNQALCALTAAIYLGCMGPQGLKDVASACASNAHYFANQLAEIQGVTLKYDGEFFHEFVTVSENADKILKGLEKQGILGGLKVGKNEILWCVTEAVSKEEMDKAANIVKEVLG
jgi:glycine dehydrogenase subunit 1